MRILSSSAAPLKVASGSVPRNVIISGGCFRDVLKAWVDGRWFYVGCLGSGWREFQPSNQTQTNFRYFAVLVVCNFIGRFDGSEGVHSVALLRCFHGKDLEGGFQSTTRIFAITPYLSYPVIQKNSHSMVPKRWFHPPWGNPHGETPMGKPPWFMGDGMSTCWTTWQMDGEGCRCGSAGTWVVTPSIGRGYHHHGFQHGGSMDVHGRKLLLG